MDTRVTTNKAQNGGLKNKGGISESQIGARVIKVVENLIERKQGFRVDSGF